MVSLFFLLFLFLCWSDVMLDDRFFYSGCSFPLVLMINRWLGAFLVHGLIEKKIVYTTQCCLNYDPIHDERSREKGTKFSWMGKLWMMANVFQFPSAITQRCSQNEECEQSPPSIVTIHLHARPSVFDEDSRLLAFEAN